MKKKITLLFTIAILFSVQVFAADFEPNDKNELSSNLINCPVPVDVVVANITSTTADFSWSIGTGTFTTIFYQYCVVSNQTPVEGPTNPQPTGSSYFDLLPGTTYYVYVRAFCEGGVWSDWSLPATFTTLCNLTTLPYSENFESVIAGTIPACTALVNSGSVSGNNWITVSNPGNGFENMTLKYTGNTEAANAYFFTKGVTLNQVKKYKISYKYGNNSVATTEKFKVIAASNPNVASLIPSMTLGDFTTINTGVAQTHSVGPFSPMPGVDTYYFAFNAYSEANQGDLYLDDIVIEEWVCGIPADPSVSDVTATSATLSWSFTGDNVAEVYQYALMTSEGVPQDEQYWPGTSFTVSTLQPETTYYLYVRAMCSGVVSEWTEVISFTTTEDLSVSESVFENFSAYPNPVNTSLTLSNATIIESVEVFNTLGQTIYSQKGYELNMVINMLDFSSGCYFLKVHSGEFTKTVRIIRD